MEKLIMQICNGEDVTIDEKFLDGYSPEEFKEKVKEYYIMGYEMAKDKDEEKLKDIKNN